MRKLSAVAIGLSLVLGALQVVNRVVFSFGPEISGGIAVILFFVAKYGITPSVGVQFHQQFDNLFHVSPVVDRTLGNLLGAAVLASTTIPMSIGLSTVIATVITVAGGLGFVATPTQSTGV